MAPSGASISEMTMPLSIRHSDAGIATFLGADQLVRPVEAQGGGQLGVEIAVIAQHGEDVVAAGVTRAKLLAADAAEAATAGLPHRTGGATLPASTASLVSGPHGSNLRSEAEVARARASEYY